MRIKNTNPMGDVFVVALGREVAAGETVTVTDEQAAPLLAQVCEVTGSRNWTLGESATPADEATKKGASK
ncbi:MAG: hypothetical protein IPM11_00760 [Micropruina sp.]|nr:hypothetical protein [Micropruina sp.]